jgi:hypothetical protein
MNEGDEHGYYASLRIVDRSTFARAASSWFTREHGMGLVLLVER